MAVETDFIEYQLYPGEIELAYKNGRQGYLWAKQRNAVTSFGEERPGDEDNHIKGFMGQIAVSRWLPGKWDSRVLKKQTSPHIGGDIFVRTSERDLRLPIRKWPDGWPHPWLKYVLAFVKDMEKGLVVLKGWTTVAEGMKVGELQSYHDYPDAYFVEVADLRPMLELRKIGGGLNQ